MFFFTFRFCIDSSMAVVIDRNVLLHYSSSKVIPLQARCGPEGE